MKVLSIDFDYFIDTDLETRNDKFPDGEDFKEDISKEWEYFYNTYPEIKKIGVVEPQFSMIKEVLKKHRGRFLEADSHARISDLFQYFTDYVEVTNIDFHHDNYISGGNHLDCANWVRFVKERFPDSKIKWIKREDSEVSSLFGDFPYEMSNDFNLEEEYDIIFMCYSPEWTPPHLRDKYLELLKSNP